MAEPTRGTRARRVNRRPGWALLTTLLVLAIVASSALVFTNRTELLKLAVILALWAAVGAAFVSFIYRRQSDVDAAKARDLKLVYDLQLDREISARREYELGVESALRRELSSELRAQAADEVASLRAELAALRTNLEFLFDTDLQHRPAIETERTSVHRFPDWDRIEEEAGPQRDRGSSPDRVISSRIDTEDGDDADPNTEESPIIDVPEEPHPPDDEWTPEPEFGGAHRRSSEPAPPAAPSRAEPAPPATPPRAEPPPPATPPRAEPPPPPLEPEVRYPWLPAPPPPVSTPRPPAAPAPAARSPWREPERSGRHISDSGSNWRPAPADGAFIPAGAPGSNWVAPVVENGSAEPRPAPPAMASPPTESRGGRHANSGPVDPEAPRPARHSASSDVAGRPQGSDVAHAPPTLATPPAPPPPPSPTLAEQSRAARHRGTEDQPPGPDEPDGQHTGGQPISELLARLQVGSTGGGRRRRREE